MKEQQAAPSASSLFRASFTEEPPPEPEVPDMSELGSPEELGEKMEMLDANGDMAQGWGQVA